MADESEIDRVLAQYGPRPLPDVRPQEMRQPPLGQSNLIDRALSIFGQPAVDATREGLEGRRTPAEVARTYLTEGPMGPFGAVRAPGRIPNPITAYHGSPHDFDRFELDKIGTGEGAQAYGHGLYFADNEAVARGYRDRLASYESEARAIFSRHGAGDIADDGWRHLARVAHGDGSERALSYAVPETRGLTPAQRQAMLDEYRNAQPGRMYEVNLHARPEQFLDWDASLPQQTPQVREALQPLLQRLAPRSDDLSVLFERGPIPAAERHGGHVRPDEYLVNLEARGRGAYPGYGASREEAYANALASFSTPSHGGGLYEALARINDGGPGQLWGRGSQPTSHALSEAGIPGIRYLDQGSRNNAFRVDLGTSRGPYRTDEPITFGTMQQAQAYADDMAARGFTTNIVDQGTRNYSVFNPEIIEILRKYGIAAPVAGATTADILSQYGPEPSPTP